MKPPPFGYVRPRSIDDALAALAEFGDDGKLLAGGQSLIPVMNFRLARPAVIIDLNRIDGLDTIAIDDGALTLGAMARQRIVETSDAVASACPVLVQALQHIGHVQIRNRGTVGGSLVHADPAAELPAIALLLGATFRLCRAGSDRTVTADEFFVGPFATIAEPDELLTQVRFPLAADTRASFAEFARRDGDFALGGICAAIVDGRPQLVAFGMGWTPVRLPQTEAVLSTGPLTDALIAEAAASAQAEVEPIDDIHADAAYRRDLVATLTHRTLTELLR